MKKLTKRQEEILNLIKAHIINLGFPPTRADIARSLGFKSPNAAEQHLRAIEKKGYIKILSGASRGIVLSDNENDQIPVIGLVAAGGPILAEENVEKTIPRSNNLLSSDIDFYLRVKGDSMVDIGIFEEDLIGVSKSANTKVGSVVVARINNEVTVKTLIEMSQNKVVLRPENQKYDDIIANPQVEELDIEGSCVALLRAVSYTHLRAHETREDRVCRVGR